MNYGIQLYSLRDITKDNFESALRQVAEMGYKMVEPAGFFGHKAEDVAAMLKYYGLTCCSTHTGFAALRETFNETVNYHKVIGCNNIILPSAPYNTKEELDETVRLVNEWIPALKGEGMKLHYHNHSHEFQKNASGQITHDELANRTDILFELDTFWVYNAQLDPVEMMEKYKSRMEFIHLKDGIMQDWSVSGSHAIGKSVGSGNAPVLAVRKKAIELGVDMVIESEELDPTGPEEVRRCIDFLKKVDESEK
jgi:sugar phosphate isomerase/epimerase